MNPLTTLRKKARGNLGKRFGDLPSEKWGKLTPHPSFQSCRMHKKHQDLSLKHYDLWMVSPYINTLAHCYQGSNRTPLQIEVYWDFTQDSVGVGLGALV